MKLTLYDFQKGLLLKAELTEDKKAKECYRDCVNFSGAMAYKLNALNEFSEESVIRSTANYQLTRFDAPKEVIDDFKTLPNDIHK